MKQNKNKKQKKSDPTIKIWRQKKKKKNPKTKNSKNKKKYKKNPKKSKKIQKKSKKNPKKKQKKKNQIIYSLHSTEIINGAKTIKNKKGKLKQKVEFTGGRIRKYKKKRRGKKKNAVSSFHTPNPLPPSLLKSIRSI